jgi:ribosomal RNA-processing protein 36
MSSLEEESENENNDKIVSKNININEDESIEEEMEKDELDDTFSQEEQNKQEIKYNEDNSEDEIEEEEENDNNNQEENNIPEELLLKDELENVDFKSLLKAKAKLSYENNKISKGNNKKKFNKNSIITQLEKINKDKKRTEPKEYSALIRPNIQFKKRNKAQQNSSLLNKKFTRDPRFDDLSGNLNEEKFKKNFDFVNNMAKEYVEKLDKVKKSKKYRKKLSDQQYELLKKQNNYMKSWINQQKQKQIKSDIKKEINKENKERYSKGQKPIFVNDNKINKFIKNKKKE